jgi:hypothetical protein
VFTTFKFTVSFMARAIDVVVQLHELWLFVIAQVETAVPFFIRETVQPLFAPPPALAVTVEVSVNVPACEAVALPFVDTDVALTVPPASSERYPVAALVVMVVIEDEMVR